MSTYLLTWNPKRSPADVEWIEGAARDSAKGKPIESRWSCGLRRIIKGGDRVFLLRQGQDKPGIVGSGRVWKGSHLRAHWDPKKKGKMACYVRVDWNILVLPENALTRESLRARKIPKPLLNNQASGGTIAPEVATLLSKLWRKHLRSVCPSASSALEETRGKRDRAAGKYADQFSRPPPRALKKRKITGETFDRDPEVRKRVLIRSKGKCESCGEPGFLTTDGRCFLETHHIIQLSEDGLDYDSNVIALCPNEHREAHYGASASKLEKRFTAIVEKKMARERQ